MWPSKVRKNLTNFFTDQTLLVLINELDPKILKIETKKEKIELEKKRKEK